MATTNKMISNIEQVAAKFPLDNLVVVTEFKPQDDDQSIVYTFPLGKKFSKSVMLLNEL